MTALMNGYTETPLDAILRFLRNTHGIFVTDAQKVQVLEWVEAGENPAEIAHRLEVEMQAADNEQAESARVGSWLPSEVPCPKCDGKGYHTTIYDPEKRPCYTCKETGLVPAEFGNPEPPSLWERLSDNDKACVHWLADFADTEDLLAAMGSECNLSVNDMVNLAYGECDLDGTDNSAAAELRNAGSDGGRL